jgi:arsenate reductase-like glutaredoxin family protein
MATTSTPTVQVFGLESDQATRAAQRFFKERRISIHFSDIRRRPMAAGELRRFADKLGTRALAETGGKAWHDAGLGYLSMTDAELFDRLLADQRLLRLPLVRAGNRFATGRDPSAWQVLLAT